MFSSRVAHLNPYVPGEQPKDRAYIKLNANENPYPPSPKVIEAVRDFVSTHPERLGLYPDPDSSELRNAIAEHLNTTGGCMNRAAFLSNKLHSENIFCGNGSDEVLSFIFYTFFDSEKPLVVPEFTYSFYPVYCGYYDIPFTKVPLKKDFGLDTERMLFLARSNSTGIIFANPNAPTGIALSTEKIREMLKEYPSDMPFVVDEAYADFAEESCIGLLSEFKNLVVVRTFSKSMSLAGMRLGYCVASPELITAITVTKNSFNHFPLDALSQAAGIAACKDTPYYVETSKKIVENRKRFCGFLKDNGWNFVPSNANFVLAEKFGVKGEQVYGKIKQDGILVRHFNTHGIEDKVRITIGNESQMAALMASMEKNFVLEEI